MANNQFKFSVSGSRNTTTIRSQSLFDTSYAEPEISPIDIYQNNMLTYKKLLGCFTFNPNNGEYIPLAETNTDEWNKLSNLLILGFISSVESYVRCLIRRLLLIDAPSKKKSYNKTLSYGAAIHHNKTLMPEALMEDCSFHSAYNIKETLKSIIGINLNNLKQHPELTSAFSSYDFIGELRHCVVHRSGLFGSNNALALGLDEYQSYLEKPIKLNLRVIQEAANACDTLVKELNDKIFCDVLVRTINNYDWKGDLRFDRKFFDKYFYLFSPNEQRNIRKACYYDFRDKCNLKYRNT